MAKTEILRELKFTVSSSSSNSADTTNITSEVPTVHWQAIGILYSCFDQRNGTPRNFGCVKSARSVLKLRNDIQAESLEGIQFFHRFTLSCYSFIISMPSSFSFPFSFSFFRSLRIFVCLAIMLCPSKHKSFRGRLNKSKSCST